jgi:hypothetical protein
MRSWAMAIQFLLGMEYMRQRLSICDEKTKVLEDLSIG